MVAEDKWNLFCRSRSFLTDLLAACSQSPACCESAGAVGQKAKRTRARDTGDEGDGSEEECDSSATAAEAGRGRRTETDKPSPLIMSASHGSSFLNFTPLASFLHRTRPRSRFISLGNHMCNTHYLLMGETECKINLFTATPT